MARKSIWISLASLAAGIAVGVVITIATRVGERRTTGTEPGASRSQKASVSDRDYGAGNAEIRSVRDNQRVLEQRLGNLEERLQTQERAEKSESSSPLPSDPSEAEAQALRQEQHATWRRVHAAEARDATWAPSAEKRLRSALQETPEMPQGFQVLDMDCRTTRCKATLSWPSYSAASQSFKQVLTMKMGCASSILLEPPEDPSKPYQAFAHYDCEGVRAEPAEH